MPPAIQLEGLGKTFGKGKSAVHAVRGLDLDVEAGQVFGFLGPNGAGKSTTIRMVMDLIRPTAGRIRIFGRQVGHDAQALRRVGALVEGARFYDHLTGRRNIEVLARTSGCFEPAEVERLLEGAGMADRADRPVGGYSTGMRQRLGVAAALLGKPELVILDEPTNGLDPAGIREMRTFVRALVDNDGITVFLSSHLLSEVEQICDRVAIVHRGRIVDGGEVAAMLAAKAHLRLSAAPLDRAMEALGERWPVRLDDGSLEIAAPREAAPEIVRQLVAAGIDVFELAGSSRSLEDFFLDVTSDDRGASP